jgi:hypothetical protein
VRSNRAVAAAALLAAAAGSAVTWVVLEWPELEWGDGLSPSSKYPGGRPIDAARIATGRLAVERMPTEVTSAIEIQSAEIVKTAAEVVKTAAALESKQQRIVGTCEPGSAIRVVGEDGTVLCQRLPRGVLSVAALGGVARASTTGTAQGSVPGAVGRYQTSGEDDWLVAPVPLPDGAIVTAFSYVFWDADEKVDGAAYLYRSDDTALAAVSTGGATKEVRVVETDQVDHRKVDATAYGYFVYFQVSAGAGKDLMPIAASVSYRLP